MRAVAILTLVLLGFCDTNDAARAEQSNVCKQCREQQKACMANYAGPTCKTEYDRCMKSCRKK
jgi:hypothetical protein